MRNTSLAIVFTVVCIDLLGFGLVLPLMPVYAKELTAGLPAGQAGWVLGLLMSSFTLMQFLFAPLWGRVSDRVGRRPVLLMSLTGSTLFYWLFGLATSWGSLAWMFAARIGAGIAGATIPTAQAYIADVTSRPQRARGMALIGAAFGLGFTLGPLIAAAAIWIAQDRGLSPWPAYVASALSGVALVVGAFLLPESLRPESGQEARRHFDLASMRRALGVPSIGLLLATGFCAVFALANFESTISLAIQAKLEASAPQSDPQWEMMLQLLLVFAYVGVIQSLVQGVLVRRLATRVGEGTLAAVGILLSVAGFVLLAAAVGWAACGVGALMLATTVEVSGIAFVFPAVQSLLSRRSDPTEQGGVLGAAESVSSLGRIAGMVFGMRLYATAATRPFWSAAGLMVVALLLAMVAVRRGRDWGG